VPDPAGAEAFYGPLAELVDAFSAAGLRDVRWIGPEESGYNQPPIVGTQP
jgi:hypothetical protein